MSVRSYWGWGLADRFPDREGRQAMGQHATSLLGFDPPGIGDPVPLDSARVATSRIAIPPALTHVLKTDHDSRARHTYGRAYPDLVRGFFGDFGAAPDLVAFPESEADIAQLMAWCAAEGYALIPYGGGTSVVGGIEPPREKWKGVVTLDVTRLDRVREVDPVSRAALIEAGATGPRLEAQLARHQLTLRHYPQSFEHSTLGGWIATRAGGHFATQRTRIDDFVEAVRMITPSGLYQTRRLPSSGAGPSPERLVLGSEGIFGVITEAWVRVMPRPEWRSRAAVSFDSLIRGAEAVRNIVQAGLAPSNCRVLDPVEAMLHGVRFDGRAVLMLAFESSDHAESEALARAVAIATKCGGVLDGEAKSEGPGTSSAAGGDPERWKNAFFQGPYLQNVMVSLGVVADTFETACTWDRFADVHAGIVGSVEAELRARGVPGKVSCRITHAYPDGLAPYYTFLAPGRLDQTALLDLWSQLKDAASDAIFRLGATITHHHAVGRTHRPWYERERPAPFAAMLKAAKRAVDPKGILNPGVLFGD